MSPALWTELEGGDLELGVTHLSNPDGDGGSGLGGIWRMLG